MIEDAELRELFGSESEEHLQSLDDGLLHLETNPQAAPVLEEVFRAAHSLKGTARMLGISGVEILAHHLEDELGDAKVGRVVLTPEILDRLNVGLGAMRRLAEEAVSGAPANVDVENILGQMKGQIPLANAAKTQEKAPEIEPPAPKIAAPTRFLEKTKKSEPKIEPKPEPEIEVTPIETTMAVIEEASQPELAPLESEENRADFKIQTMRVPPAKLDALMTQAGELTVTTNRVTRGLATFSEMGELWEEWNRELAGLRPARVGANDNLAQKIEGFHGAEQARLVRLRALWEHLRSTIYEDITRLVFVAESLEESIRNVRLLPLSTVFNLFPRMVRDLARSQEKAVQFVIQGAETTADKRILEELKDPLMHMIRNAIDHGIEPPKERQQNGKSAGATLVLRARQTASNVIVELQDDGRGLDVASIKRAALKKRLRSDEELAAMSPEQIQMLIFAPGFSTSQIVTDVSGRGVGLDVVRANIERLKGSIQIASTPGEGCTFTILFPLTLATARVLLVEVAGWVYALPVESVQSAINVAPDQFFTIEGRQTIVWNGEAITIAELETLLELKNAPPPKRTRKSNPVCVILTAGTEKIGLLVDELVDEQEVMIKPLGALLKRVRNVSGVTILGAGEVCMILNPHDLVKSAFRARTTSIRALETTEEKDGERRKVILLAEDSITTRTQEKRILESAGYEVVTAVDGADALQKLGTREFDGVISDVEMPNLDGISFVARLRQDPKNRELPVILVTSLASDADKRRGIEVGANAYITKGTFEQKVLIETLGRLV